MPLTGEHLLTRPPQTYGYGIAANIAGAVIYLWLASATWIDPDLRDVVGPGAADPFIYAASAFPVLLAFGLGNLVWLTRVVRRDIRMRTLGAVWVIPVVGMLWLTAIAIDFGYR